MHVFTRLALCLLLLPATAQALYSQQLINYVFTAEVTTLFNQDNSYNIAVGDEITGILMYDPTIQPNSSGPSASVFDLNEGANKMSAMVNGHEFSSVKPDDGEFRDGGFSVYLTRNRSDDNGGQICYNGIQFTSNFGLTSDPKTPFTQISMTFDNEDCEYDNIINSLPTNINLADWTRSATLSINRFENTDTEFFLQARITSINAELEDGGRVQGKVFADYNSDCDFNGTDQQLIHSFVKFTPGSYRATVDANGDYSITLPLGDYEAEVVERELWTQACPAGPAVINLADDNTSVTADFAMEAEQLIEAVQVSVSSGRARPGFDLTYFIMVRNIGTLPYSGTIRFTHDDVLTEFSANPAPDSYDNPTAEWELTDLPVDHKFVISVTMKIPADDNLLGSFICSSVESEQYEHSSDELQRISKDEVCQEIRGSWDPNDIQVFIGDRNADGAILPEDKVLTYLIRFQNEGNEEATTVRVVDELSEFHNIDKIRIGAASHDFSFNFTSDGALEWTFSDINLPPISVDEIGSQGYFKFDVHLKDELASGTEIPNSAAIYFDFNSPVLTNTVVSRIAGTTTSVDDKLNGTSIGMFPNPTSDKLAIRFESVQMGSLTLTNMLGETVMTRAFHGSAQDLDLRSLAVGNYYLTIRTAQGMAVKSVSIVR